MKLWDSQVTRTQTLWAAAGCLAVAISGGAGFQAAGSAVTEDGVALPVQGTARLPADIAPSKTAQPQVAPHSVSGAVKSGDRDVQEQARMVQIWEVSIGAEVVPSGSANMRSDEVWRIGGVFVSTAGPALIVVSGITGSPRYLSVGAILPNGAEIVAIAQDSVTVRTRVNRRWVPVTLTV